VHAKEQLGQNFLIDREALTSIVRAAAPMPGEQVLEIGPGIGTLTLALAETGAIVHAVELDKTMARITASRCAGLSTVTVHEGNILHSDLAAILDVRRPFTVVANIPYYITAPILRMFLEGPHRPDSLVLMVQREVGERLAAVPGHMSALSVITQIHAAVEIVRAVPASSFLPPPEVQSVVLRLRLHDVPPVPVEEQPYLFRVVKAGFGSKRKMIHNALDQGLPNRGSVIDDALASAGVERNRRAETLSIAEWRALARALHGDVEHRPRRPREPRHE
jgi:16S rRNA (adenine1518-N6/adenine1519-N6)-dimethyltransferase